MQGGGIPGIVAMDDMDGQIELACHPQGTGSHDITTMDHGLGTLFAGISHRCLEQFEVVVAVGKNADTHQKQGFSGSAW